MRLAKGNMWDVFDEADHFIFTGNAHIKANGAVVMGRGIAKAVRNTFPGIDVKIGARIQDLTHGDTNGFYGLILGWKIGIFQVKYHWGDNADLELIRKSTAMLHEKASIAPNESFHMNFPAIGNGGRAYNTVLPIIEDLPDNVVIWTFN